jgi:transcriptional regulator with GAF, ATPase, and Fis domain
MNMQRSLETQNEFLEKIRLLEEQVQDFEKLNKVLATVCSTIQVEEVLKRILEEALTLCNTNQASIFLLGPTIQDEAKTLVRGGPSRKIRLDHYMNTLLVGWTSRNKKPLLTDNLIDTFGREYIESKYDDISSAMSVPLILNGDIIGVINLITLKGDPILGKRELRLMMNLASHCVNFIQNARLHEKLFEETKRLKKEVQDKYTFHGIIGQSPKMQEVFLLLEKVMTTEGRVLLEGESGTGKELIARVIHYGGPRKDQPFVAVDCGALPSNLLESELFGYVKGAFTGATQDRKGLFEEAHSGTLFLDEIANMPLEVQSKFLRVIQEGEIRPLGTNQLKKVDVRIIAAASGELRDKVDEGKFREDLFYRLNVVNIFLPPLRERKEDIALLTKHFLKQMNNKYNKNIIGFKPETINKLESYAWPGNVRELENVLERLTVLAEDNLEYISPHLLPEEIHPRNTDLPISDFRDTSIINIKRKKAMYEKEMILAALHKHNWNQSSAARELGVTEKAVRYKMQKLNIKKP